MGKATTGVEPVHVGFADRCVPISPGRHGCPEWLIEQRPLLGAFCEERVKGLEPSTFCMASRRSSQLSYTREARAH